jgi:hypothetical protein
LECILYLICFPANFWDKLMKESPMLGSMLAAGRPDSLSLPPPPSPLPSQSAPSEDRIPSPSASGPLVNPDTLSATGPQPASPQSLVADPEIHSLINSEPFPAEFWDKILKGKIKRQISGSNAGNLAKRTQGHEYSIHDDLQFNG